MKTEFAQISTLILLILVLYVDLAILDFGLTNGFDLGLFGLLGFGCIIAMFDFSWLIYLVKRKS